MTANVSLPKHLQERTRERNSSPLVPHGEYVLYWMRTAVRAHENPALDAAIEVANQLEKPVFVYHAVSERYPFASDRHHTFILEGARDVSAALNARGIGYAFHCEREDHRGPHLETLASCACLVITEEMPVEPLRGLTERLATRLARASSVPLWTIDTATVVPMQRAGKAIERAFQYRKKVWKHLEECVVERADAIPKFPHFVPALPFRAVDFEKDSIPSLVAACDIDHTVGPVRDTPGGSRAGYARWRGFFAKLSRYAEDRNDPVKHGVSRMSAYLHYGMVAPTRLARESFASMSAGSKGAEKYLDELIVWRELAYTWCQYSKDHDSLRALPDWAQQTLQAHSGDPREFTFDWETLARAKTGNRLWDAAQRSLLVHGELHNNVRMTWGKALLGWTSSPARALELLLDLNHRYALDGRDPASYGGLLWCLGRFDRPFPESPVFGTIRTRSITAHQERFDLDAFEKHIERPRDANSSRIAIVGAGPAGAMLARTLQDHGLDITVFDKGRSPGGRTSVRRTGDGFDHGAQFVRFREGSLAQYVDAWKERGILTPWPGPFGELRDGRFFEENAASERWVGQPGMNELVRHLLQDVDVRFGTKVDRMERDDERWVLSGAEGTPLGTFEHVLLAIPAPQASSLLGVHPLAKRLDEVEFAPCWALMADAVGAPPIWSGATVSNPPLAWVARNASKPGRTRTSMRESWVLHADPDWSRRNLELPPSEVASQLKEAFSTLPGVEHLALENAVAHRWRFALVTRPVGEAYLFDEETGVGICGDSLLGARVEAAIKSGAALAGHLLRKSGPAARKDFGASS